MSAFTPGADSIVGTDNFVLQKIEFLGTDISAPLDSVAGTVMDGTGAFDNDTWHFAEISGTAPAGTTSIRRPADLRSGSMVNPTPDQSASIILCTTTPIASPSSETALRRR